MAQYNEEITIAYGGFSVGGSTARQLDGENPLVINEGYEDGYVEFQFITTAASEAALATEVAAVEAAFRKPRQALLITQGSETILSRSHSGNTGLDTNPTITKAGDIADTGRSRHYTVRVEYGMPADNVGTSGRRWSNINVEYDASNIRTVTITGTYTATSDTGASFAQYRSEISSYFTTVVSGIDSGASWEIIGEPSVERNETDKVTNFTIVGKEIIFNQASGVLNDSAIKNPTLTISRMREEPGDAEGGGFAYGTSEEAQALVAPSAKDNTKRRPITLTVSYNCSIDKAVTKQLASKWKSTIRPFLIKQTKQALSGFSSTAFCLIQEKPDFNYYANSISAEMTFMSFNTDVMFEKVIKITDDTKPNKQLVPVASGDPYAYYQFPGPAIRVRTAEFEYKKQIGGSIDATVDSLVSEIDADAQGAIEKEEWVQTSGTPQVEDKYVGLEGANKVRVVSVRVTYSAQRRNKIQSSIANVGGITGAVIDAG